MALSQLNTDFDWDRSCTDRSRPDSATRFSTEYCSIKETNEPQWSCADISMIFCHILLQTAWMFKDFPWCEVSRALDELMSHAFMYICVLEHCFRPERSFVTVYICTLVQNRLACCLWWNCEIKIRLKSRGHCYYFKSSQSRNIGRTSWCDTITAR